jgi:hypothetical protein
MVAEHRYRAIKAAVSKRQRLGRRPNDWRGLGRALGDHHGGWLDGDDITVGGLVRAGSSADVDHGAGVAQRL